MLDILQLRINATELQQLRHCQLRPPSDCHAAFTVTSPGAIWPVASWSDPAADERINVRGWFPLLDQIADELLLWWPKGGCCFVKGEEVTFRRSADDRVGVLFLHFEMNGPIAVAPKARRSELIPRFIS
jgi:hypothetical protein